MLRSVPGTGDGDRPDQGSRTACAVGVCDGSGWVLRDDGQAEPCACREGMIGRAASRGMGTGIPKKFRGVGFDRKPIVDLDPFVRRHVQAYVGRIERNLSEGRGLWFYGDVGTGKTSLAMLIAKEAEKAHLSIAIYSAPRLFAEIRSTFDTDRLASTVSLLRRLGEVDLLLLDDLGAQRQTDWVTEQLYSIVNERWQDGKAIVATYNSAPAKPSTVLKDLQDEIDYLRRSRERRQALDVDATLERLEFISDQLGKYEPEQYQDPLGHLRKQLGARTVSRLVEICGDPLPIMGADLRISQPT